VCQCGLRRKLAKGYIRSYPCVQAPLPAPVPRAPEATHTAPVDKRVGPVWQSVMEELVPGRVATGEGEPRRGYFFWNYLMGKGGRERKQQRGEREKREEKRVKPGTCLVFGSSRSRRGRKVVRSGEDEEGEDGGR
jgi:hypothetical protein